MPPPAEKTFTQFDVEKARQDEWRKCVNAVCAHCRGSTRPPIKGTQYHDSPWKHGALTGQVCLAGPLWDLRPPVVADTENVRFLVAATGKSEAVCRVFLEKEGGDFEKAVVAIKAASPELKGY